MRETVREAVRCGLDAGGIPGGEKLGEVIYPALASRRRPPLLAELLQGQPALWAGKGVLMDRVLTGGTFHAQMGGRAMGRSASNLSWMAAKPKQFL